MKYNAARGGHAPGHIRDAFRECIDDVYAENWYDKLSEEDTLFFRNPNMQRNWQTMSLADRARWLTGQLWNCTDLLPWLDCEGLELPHGTSYCIAARKLRGEIK